jgi:LysM repeat protein/uncharacterized protein YkwD
MHTALLRNGITRFLLQTLAVLAIAGGLAFSTFQKVSAQSGTPNELIAAINALRVSYGLVPYTVDSGLMSTAQAHADYMASIGTLTHLRADGTTPAVLGFLENIAGGMSMSPANAVGVQWTDQLHLITMIGYTQGSIGAGVTIKNNFAYYAVDVYKGGKATGYDTSSGLPTATPASSTIGYAFSTETPTPEVITEVITVTPQADGRVIHVVQPGQSAWSIAIAYGTTIQEIAKLNNLNPASPVIYTGQGLLIRTIETATAGPTDTATSLPPTRTPRPTSTRRPPTQIPTVTATPSATPAPLIPRVDPLANTDTHLAGYIIIAICGIGLLTVITFSLRGK